MKLAPRTPTMLRVQPVTLSGRVDAVALREANGVNVAAERVTLAVQIGGLALAFAAVLFALLS